MGLSKTSVLFVVVAVEEVGDGDSVWLAGGVAVRQQ